MPKPYSNDLRARVIGAVSEGASRRETAERFEVGISTVVVWAQRWKETGSVTANPSGGSTSPLEEHAESLLDIIAKQPDLTLDEVVVTMRKRGIEVKRTAVWRFFKRHKITYKKKPAGDGAEVREAGSRTPAMDARAGHV
jgi:transposase